MRRWMNRVISFSFCGYIGLSDYRTVISEQEGNIRSANGTESDNITTIGWDVMVLFKDEYTHWIQLKDTKD